jgi:hypothetical protein
VQGTPLDGLPKPQCRQESWVNIGSNILVRFPSISPSPTSLPPAQAVNSSCNHASSRESHPPPGIPRSGPIRRRATQDRRATGSALGDGRVGEIPMATLSQRPRHHTLRHRLRCRADVVGWRQHRGRERHAVRPRFHPHRSQQCVPSLCRWRGVPDGLVVSSTHLIERHVPSTPVRITVSTQMPFRCTGKEFTVDSVALSTRPLLNLDFAAVISDYSQRVRRQNRSHGSMENMQFVR